MELKEIRLMNESMIKYLESIGKNAQRNIIIKNMKPKISKLSKM